MRALIAALLLVAAAPAGAESPLAAQVRVWATRYHENPARLDALRADLAPALERGADIEDLLALAQVSFIWGDVRGRTRDEKLRAYDQGRQAARRATELAPRSVLAHFWLATNTGRWGQTNGIVRSLFLLRTVKEELDIVLALDPAFPPAYSLAGHVYVEVPPLLGGDLARAERMFRTGLALAPAFTGMRVGLAKTLVKQGRLAEARQELAAVLAETAPANPADWAMKDSVEARALLASLGGAR
jgi:hypothetical protein